MRLIIAGTRSFNDYKMLRFLALDFIKDEKDVEIVSGMAQGADKLGEQFAKEFGFPIKQFPANWALYGRSAGPIRNEEMAQYATHCLCFWDGQSSGTKSMMNLAKEYGLKLATVLYSNGKKNGGNKGGKTGGSSSGVLELV